jgi:two-component system OmpR family response regulator
MRILLIEDDVQIGTSLMRALKDADYAVDWVRDGNAGREALDAAEYTVVLLDLGLPGMTGIELLRQARTAGNATPVLILTARDDVDTRVQGLDLGADDYLLKPFNMPELLARIRAVLRRTRMLPPGMLVEESTEMLSFGDWRLDTTARHLLDTEDAVVALSGAEYRLLRAFLDHPQRVLTRDQLLNLTQRRNAEPFDRSIDLLVSRLRQRLRDVARVPRYIKTLRNEGYVFSSTVKAVEEARARQHA